MVSNDNAQAPVAAAPAPAQNNPFRGIPLRRSMAIDYSMPAKDVLQNLIGFNNRYNNGAGNERLPTIEEVDELPDNYILGDYLDDHHEVQL
jgi:hypothetical protein